MILENIYLQKAISKAGYVVIVKKCSIKERKGKLEYISPNASMLGMNVELLNKGMKLTEDYIHPEDREKVIQTVISAAKNKVSDYVHKYRMVGDDGNLYYVSNEISMSDIQDEYITIEFYLKAESGADDSRKNISAYSEGEDKNLDKNEEKQNAVDDIGGIPVGLDDDMVRNRIQTTIRVFSELSDLYSVFVDMDCKIKLSPVGPSTNMGDFYDLFEKPSYKEYFKYIKQVIINNDAPTILDREEGGIGKISAAPIKANGSILGLWILGSYTEQETEKLRKMYENHWVIAQMLSDYATKNTTIEKEIAKSKGAGVKLREELARQNIINDALSKINSKLVDNVDKVVEETIREVGIHMNIDKVFMYTVDRTGQYEFRLRSYWDALGDYPDVDFEKTLPERMRFMEDNIKQGNGQYVVDSSLMNEDEKLSLMRYNMKAVIAYPLYMNNKFYGAIFFVATRSARIWSSNELRFTRSIALVIQNMIENAEGDDNIRTVNRHLIATYNNFKVGIFVRDTYSGEVLFSNSKMNEMLGYDFTGGDSRVILTDLHDRFDNITGMRKPFITKEKIVNWRSYIKSLDDIMDITEIQIEWLNGEDASLIILRKAKDL